MNLLARRMCGGRGLAGGIIGHHPLGNKYHRMLNAVKSGTLVVLRWKIEWRFCDDIGNDGRMLTENRCEGGKTTIRQTKVLKKIKK